MDRLVTIKSNRYGMELRMNPDVPFEEIQKAVVEKFTDAAGFFKNARMAISFTGIYRSGKVSSIKGRSESVRYWKVNQVS